MSEDRKDAIRVALLTIAAAHNVKPTKLLFSSWMIAIDNLSPDEIAETTKYCLQRRKSAFLPTPGEFIEIAEQLKAEAAKEKRINEEIAESNRYLTHNPEGKKKVLEMAAKIGANIGKKKVDQPKIAIYEYMDKNGNCNYAANGEIDFELFKEQVYLFCGQYPQRIRREHKRFETVKKKYDDESIRTYSTYVVQDQPGPDTKSFTVGYL